MCLLQLVFLFLMRLTAGHPPAWKWVLTNPIKRPTGTEIIDYDAINYEQEINITHTGIFCTNDRICGRSSFCDFHYGVCKPKRAEGELCRKDGHCLKNFICVFGRCNRIIRHGLKGARCKSDKECNDNLCCARQHGEYICKAYLPENDNCYVPNGGLGYSLNELCPCQENLICRANISQNVSRLTTESSLWTDIRNMKCLPRL